MTDRVPPRVKGVPPAPADARSGRVVLLSHCLLDQNTRYPGGAVCPGAVSAAVEPYLRDGTGMVQMPCPEQRVWGGVRRPPLRWAVRHRRAAGTLARLMPVVEGYLRWRYRHLARDVARDVRDFVRSGVEVTAVVGVAGSPSCGVATTMDLRAAAVRVAGAPQPLTWSWLSEEVVAGEQRPGPGLFTDALQKEMARRRISLTFAEHTLRPVGPAPGPGRAP